MEINSSNQFALESLIIKCFDVTLLGSYSSFDSIFPSSAKTVNGSPIGFGILVFREASI